MAAVLLAVSAGCASPRTIDLSCDTFPPDPKAFVLVTGSERSDTTAVFLFGYLMEEVLYGPCWEPIAPHLRPAAASIASPSTCFATEEAPPKPTPVVPESRGGFLTWSEFVRGDSTCHYAMAFPDSTGRFYIGPVALVDTLELSSVSTSQRGSYRVLDLVARSR